MIKLCERFMVLVAALLLILVVISAAIAAIFLAPSWYIGEKERVSWKDRFKLWSKE